MLSDLLMKEIVDLSEGNPGAINVMSQLLQNMIGPLCIGILKKNNIKGSKIWMLYKDVCKQNLDDLIVLISSLELSILNIDQVNHAIENYGDGIDLNKINKEYQRRIEND